MRKIISLLSVLLCLSVLAIGQTRVVTGKVTDANGTPIPNATVLVKGTTSGTVSKSDGTYSIKVSPNAKTIVFSGAGLDPVEYSIGNKGIINTTLVSSDKALQEVVVVGYGTQKRKELTGSTASVKGASIAEKPLQSFDQGLAGKASGVQITVPSGLLNSPPVFRIRGTNSISLSSYPLIVIDGVPTFTDNTSSASGTFSTTSAASNPLSSINANDIESIDIAKDAAATAIYGSRAANGVVFITTKKGRSGKAKVSYDGWVGFSNEYGLPKMMNASQYIAEKTQAVANALSFTVSTAPKFISTNDANGNPIDTKWFDYIYHRGISHSHNINVSGGNDNTTYYFSAGYTDQNGIIRTNEYSRINVLFNVDSRLSKTITIGSKISYSDEFNKIATSSGTQAGEAYNTGGLGRVGMVLPPILAPYNNDGSYNIAGSTIGYSNNVTGTSIAYYNPVPSLDLNRSNNEVNHTQANAYIQIKPLSWITLKSLYGIDNLLIDNDLFETPITGDGYSNNGFTADNFGKYKTWLWTNTAQFDQSFGKHNLSLLVGNEQQRRTGTGYGLQRQNLSDPAYTVIQAGYTVNNPTSLVYGENYLLSNFGRLNYNYNKKYLLSGNIRQDEYSALGVKKGTFYGVSAGWEIAQEKFWETSKLNKVFSSLKIRGSFGKVGNIGGINDYSPYSTYASNLYGGLSTLYFNTVGNNQLKWETSKKTDVGFSFGILKDRITGDVAYYKNTIDGLILNVGQSPSTGLPTGSAPTSGTASPTIAANVGSMYNQGFEFSINALIINSKDFSWNSSFNLTLNKNMVTALAPGLPYLLTNTSSLETLNRTQVGYSLGTLWLEKSGGVDPSTGKRIFINGAGTKVYYQNAAAIASSTVGQNSFSTTADGTTKYVSATGGTTITQAADAVMEYNVLPKQVGGWDNNFKYKNFDLGFTFTYQFGFYVYYGTNAGLHDQRFWNNATDILTDAWANVGDVNKKYAKPVFGDNVSNASPLDINAFKGDFVKLKNVSIGYSIPQSILDKAKISSLRIYVSGQNLGIFTKYPGPDPEVSSNGNGTTGQGVDRNTIANARTITFGVKVGF